MPPTPANLFLKAVIANPDDDLTRLVYADWLDETGQPERAEFIRVQVALAVGVSDDAHRRHLEGRQRELLIAHDTTWVSELAEVLNCEPGRWGGWVFRRGFVEYFHLPATTLIEHGVALAELTPLRELYLNPVEQRDVTALCRRPWLTRVRDLYLLLGRDGLEITAARALVRSPYTTGLKKLVLHLATGVRANPSLMEEFEARFHGIWTG